MTDALDRALLTHASITRKLKTAILAPDLADIEFVRSDRLCAFGQWIYSSDGLRYCGYPEFYALRETHRRLHQVAFGAMCDCRDGKRQLVCESLETGEFFAASSDLKVKLLELRRARRRKQLRRHAPLIRRILPGSSL